MLAPRYFAALLLLSAPLAAQQIKDPANLTGEHVSAPSLADSLPINHGAPALQQLLHKLHTRASMMMIVAHPDDEDGGLLTFASRGQGARVAMLTLTRGEGGQNLMSSDFDDALGLIRTQELLAEDRYMGVDQFFGTEVDFGFSKTKEESFAQWTHDRVLYDAVRAVRLYRPLVLASVFVGGVTDGHGHHQVAGEITQEVFLAAADPNVFPQMIAEGLLPWAPLKVFARVPFSRVTEAGMFDYATGRYSPARFHNYVTGKDIQHEPSPSVLIHEGAPATLAGQPALGMEGETYVQFARRGLALQKTQIGPNSRLAPPGRYDVAYILMAQRQTCIPASTACPLLAEESASQPLEDSLFAGLDTSLPGIATLAPSLSAADRALLTDSLTNIEKSITQAEQQFRPDDLPQTSTPLRNALTKVDTLIQQIEARTPNQLQPEDKFNLLHELRIKRVQLNDAIVLALGITYRATVASPSSSVVAGSTITITTELNTGAAPLRADSADLPARTSSRQTRTVAIPARAPISKPSSTAYAPSTSPYFSRPDLEQPFYNVSQPALRNAPQTPAPFVMSQKLSFVGTELELRATASADSSPTQPLVIVPRFSVELSPSVAIVSTHQHSIKPVPLTVAVRSNVETTSPQFDVGIPEAWVLKSQPPSQTIHLGQERRFDFAVTPVGIAPSASLEKIASIRVYATEPAVPETPETSLGYRSVGYPGLPVTNLYRPAATHVIAVDLAVPPNLRIAYLPGTGDDVPRFLPALGVTPTLLTPADLTPASLARFDAVLLGVRAFSANSALPGPALVDYARAGGIVIAQYNTGSFPANATPYPLEIPGDPAHNVVEEAQPVSVLAPNHPLLTWPNKIIAADFNHWVAERGHGFPATWSKNYTPLLETHDVDQDPQRGGLLVAPVGKGAYIYCAFALYRQLPEGVPGAYRLLANLLSYARNPTRTAQ